MATKYGPKRRHNSGTVRRSTNTTGGSRTRSTVTTKTGNFTRSRSVNRNGTVRQTTTHKSPSGFITRTVKTIGSSPSKPKKPKFIVPKVFKLPKFKKSKGATISRSKSVNISWPFLSRRRRTETVQEEYDYDDGEESRPLPWWDWIFLILLSPFLLLIKLLWPIVSVVLLYMFYFILAVSVVIIFLAIIA